MAKNVFSVSIFFLLFRETLEIAIIISVLLGLVEQVVHADPIDDTPAFESPISPTSISKRSEDSGQPSGSASPTERASAERGGSAEDDTALTTAALARKMRIQIFAGSFSGLFIALAIGAAFIGVWYTQGNDLWGQSDTLWLGILKLLASILIFGMSITILNIDRAKLKWNTKLRRAFSGKKVDSKVQVGKWMLFILPFITVLREGLEAVVVIGDVNLGEPATSVPIAVIVGLLCGVICGYVIYAFGSRTTLSIFTVVMTNFYLLIGAGLFSEAVWQFQQHAFLDSQGQYADEAIGDGPGTFNVIGNVWYLNCCNPDNDMDNGGWMIFNALFGWTNSGSLGTILAYVFYWITVIAVLVYMKWHEGRTTLFGWESAAAVRNRKRALRASRDSAEKEGAVDDAEL